MRAIMVMFDSLNRRLLPNLRRRRDPGPELRAARANERDLRQLLRGQHAVHAGSPGAAHRPLQLPAPLAGARSSRSTTRCPRCSRTTASTPTSRRTTSTTGRTAARPTTPATAPWSSSAARRATPGRGTSAASPRRPSDNGDNFLTRQDWVNRLYLTDRGRPPADPHLRRRTGVHRDQRRTSRTGSLQIETFDPHEPFFSYERYRELYRHGTTSRIYDWPSYRRVIEDDEHGRARARRVLRAASRCATTRSAASWTSWTSTTCGTTRC